MPGCNGGDVRVQGKEAAFSNGFGLAPRITRKRPRGRFPERDFQLIGDDLLAIGKGLVRPLLLRFWQLSPSLSEDSGGGETDEGRHYGASSEEKAGHRR